MNCLLQTPGSVPAPRAQQARRACRRSQVTFSSPKPNSRNTRARKIVAMASSNGNGNGNGAAAAQPAKQTVTTPIKDLEVLTAKALKSIGYNDQEVEVISKVCFYAQLRDNNQGLIKITSGGLNRSATAGTPKVVKDTPLSAVIDGQGESGMLVLNQAVDMALSKARNNGMAIVGTNHTCTSTGALGFYADKVAQAGLIGIVLAQSPEFVAPYGAKQAVFGTNPIAVAIPTPDGEPMVMDMATAAYAWFGLLEAKTAGMPIPGNVAYNAQGELTTDPNEVLQGGAIRVFDGSYKGSNLALMVELLAGPLVGAAVADKMAERNWGNLVIVIDPQVMGNKEVILERMKVVMERVKGAEKLPGVQEILLPGERGQQKVKARHAAGSMPVEANLYARLRAMAEEYDAVHGQQQAKPSGHKYKLATQLVHGKSSVKDPYDATVPPLYQTATFAQPGATTGGEFDYTRSGNPTRHMLEEQMAVLEGGDRAFAFTSGMAALAAAAKLVKSGEHIVAGDDIYGGTSRLLSQVVPAAGVSVSNVDLTDLEAVRRAMIPGKTKMLMVESPTNPRMQVCDIKALAEIAHAAGALCLVDNSFMSPIFQRPLELGADISMISGTKFIGGHSDVTCGVLSVKGEELAKRVYFLQNAEGAGLAPFDCWLALRGLKTMALRQERQADNCMKLAQYLAKHPLVKRINYAGLPTHPGHDIHKRQCSSGGSVLSFETGSVEASRVIVEQSKLFKITVSFGNVTSQISLPCYMSHASIPKEVRAARGLPDDLVRISTGIEDAEDLLADLDQAMQQAMEVAGVAGSSGLAGGDDGASDREQQLMQRIRELEAQLATKS